MKKLLTTVLLALLLVGVSAVPDAARADTILKFGLSEVGPDLLYQNGELVTRDDMDASTLGQQNTGINFVGFLAGVIPDIISGASATLDGVNAVGTASELNSVIVQQTNGGVFSLWDQNNVLLIQAELGEGAVTGTSTAGTGSFFNTQVVNLTGGTLLAYVLAAPAGISFALASIATGGVEGLSIVNGALADFSANASGLLTGQPVPEPTTVALLLSSLVGLGVKRRRAAQKL